MNAQGVARRVVVLLLPLLLCSSSGCAVLTVDVDVYKGPLANHVDVQKQQTAVIALAAKPLLAKLRYELERYAESAFIPVWFDEPDSPASLELKHSTDWVQPKLQPPYPNTLYLGSTMHDVTEKFFGKPKGQRQKPTTMLVDPFGGFYFYSQGAEFVNRILAEYNDTFENEQLAEAQRSAADADANARLATAPSVMRPSTQPSQAAQDKYLAGLVLTWSVPADKLKTSFEDYRRQLRRARARSGPGVETYVYNYEFAKQKSDAERPKEQQSLLPDDSYSLQEGELFDVLIHFGEKILFVVNNEAMFQEHHGVVPGLVVGIKSEINGGSDPDAVTDSYVRVLQAVGNSLVVNLDELREHDEHRDRLIVGRTREQSALGVAEAGSRSGFQEIDRILSAGRAELAMATADLEAKTKELDAASGNLSSDQLRKGDRDPSGKPNGEVTKKTSPITQDKEKALKELSSDVGNLTKKKAQLEHAIEEISERVQIVLVDPKHPNEAAPNSLEVVDRLLVNMRSARNSLEDAEAQAPKGRAANGQAAKETGAETAAKETAAKETAAKETAAKETAAKETAAKETAAKETAAKETAAKETAAKETAATKEAGPKGPAAEEAAAKGPTVKAQGAKAPTTNEQAVVKARQQSLEDAIAYLEAHQPNATLGLPAEFKDQPKTAEDVLDDLITTLNYRYIDTVAEFGKDSVTAKQLKDAMDAAYAHRSDMIYIRPASAYLRASFLATSLQRDARLGWSNMLEEQQLHQVPLYSDRLFHENDYRTLQELDKQSWQNVNTIRVAGGGNVNYVIAKDDVGNWYVKNYSTDVGEIIDSAQQLALFSLAPALKTVPELASTAKKNAAAATNTGTNTKGTGTTTGIGNGGGTSTGAGGGNGASAGSAASTQPSALDQELKREQQRYDTETLKDLQAVLEDEKGLADRIKALWNTTELADLQSDLGFLVDEQVKAQLAPTTRQSEEVVSEAKPSAGASDATTGAANAKGKGAAGKGAGGNDGASPNVTTSAAPSTQPADQILEDLEAMRRFHNSLSAKVLVLSQIDISFLKQLDDAKAARERAAKDYALVRKFTEEYRQALSDRQDDLLKAMRAQSEKKQAADAKGVPGTSATNPSAKDAVAGKATPPDQVADAKAALEKATRDLKDAEAEEQDKQQTDSAAAEALANAQAALTKRPDAIRAANRAMTDLVRTAIESGLQRRQAVLDRLQTAIDIIADAGSAGASNTSGSSTSGSAGSPAK